MNDITLKFSGGFFFLFLVVGEDVEEGCSVKEKTLVKSLPASVTLLSQTTWHSTTELFSPWRKASEPHAHQARAAGFSNLSCSTFSFFIIWMEKKYAGVKQDLLGLVFLTGALPVQILKL